MRHIEMVPVHGIRRQKRQHAGLVFETAVFAGAQLPPVLLDHKERENGDDDNLKNQQPRDQLSAYCSWFQQWVRTKSNIERRKYVRMR